MRYIIFLFNFETNLNIRIYQISNVLLSFLPENMTCEINPLISEVEAKAQYPCIVSLFNGNTILQNSKTIRLYGNLHKAELKNKHAFEYLQFYLQDIFFPS